MKELTASIDSVADYIEAKGHVIEAAKLDVYSNTLDLLNDKISAVVDPKNKQYTNKIEQGKTHIETELKNISYYLTKYLNLLRSEHTKEQLSRLGEDFPEKVVNTLIDLRKYLIEIKMNLGVLEPDTGGLS